ncbi:MAG TPA: UDP-3-O-acyl-N-acetylglucosamine deacetylase [Exilispira sp.]|nr:UDP-3-O-acyl-N-acetylglucosamine deacetylase [Exilispira sp.]
MKRKTITKAITREGVTLHSGNSSSITFRPSYFRRGILFYNTQRDPYKLHPIPLSPFIVSNTSFSTAIGNDYRIYTIEHILAALQAMEISDIIIEVEGDEVPVFDGSSYCFIEMLREAQIEELDEEITPYIIKYPIWVYSEDKYIIGMPSSQFSITYSIDFSSKSDLLPYQVAYFNITSDIFIREISRARTFGFLEDYENMKQNNLARGGSLDNALIYTRESILNDEIRYSNEALRHKILDLIGDLYLLGKPVVGHIIAHKAGHSLDVQFAKKFFWHEKANESSENIKRILKDFDELSSKLKLSSFEKIKNN